MSGEEESILITEDEILEDAPQDWGSINRPSDVPFLKDIPVKLHDESLPKRSEKFFDQDGSQTLLSSLDSAREQMYLALSYMRGHHTKHSLVGVWVQSQNRAFIPHAKGGSFKDMGTPHVYKRKEKLQGMWLNTIETIYLAERGSLILYLANEAFLSFMVDDALFFNYDNLTNFTLAHLYTNVLSRNHQDITQYKVYSLLKRLGYSVMEQEKHEKDFALPNSPLNSNVRTFQFIKSKIRDFIVNIGAISRSFGFSFLSRQKHYFNFTHVFESLAISSADDIHQSLQPPFKIDPRYRIRFNVWKPSSSFSKKNPPQPDFQLGIIDTSTMPFPCLSMIKDSWNQLESGPKHSSTGRLKTATLNKKAIKNLPGSKKDIAKKRKADREAKLAPEIRDRNDYLRRKDHLFKQGSAGQAIVFAIVNDGVVNFAIFGKTDFQLKSCIESLNELEQRDNHGIIWNEKLDLRTLEVIPVTQTSA